MKVETLPRHAAWAKNHPMMVRTLNVLTFGILVLVACGGDDPAPEKYPSFDSFCDAKATEECTAIASACSVTVESCKGVRKNACSNAAGAALGQGREYVAGNAEGCVSKIADLYKDRVLDATKEKAFDEACAKVFLGVKKKSEPCSNEYHCEASLVCDMQKGVCAEKTAARKDRDPCNNPGDTCDTGLFCNQEGANRFCAAKAKAGAACNEATPCAEDLFCNVATCAMKNGAGATCATDIECTTRFCNPDTKKCQAKQYATETGTCRDFGGL
jgi:hypothetical protein